MNFVRIEWAAQRIRAAAAPQSIQTAEPAAPPARHGAYSYSSYDGAWGLGGEAAGTAYLDRTAYWVRVYDDAQPYLGQA